MSSYIQISGTPRTPWAEEALTVDGTLRHPDATKTAGSLMARARLQGGPIRIQMLTADVEPDQDGDRDEAHERDGRLDAPL